MRFRTSVKFPSVLSTSTAVFFILFACCRGSFSQAPDANGSSPVTTLSVDARLVNLPVVVRDKKGALVQGLHKGDFSLSVDGKPQVIKYFDIDSNLPLTLGLLIDTSMSQRDVLDEERSASGTFLDQMLKSAADRAFIVQFARETELLADLTNSRSKLQAALKQVDTPAPRTQDDVQNDPSADPSSSDPQSRGKGHRGGGSHGAGTTLYDAVFLASDELMSKQKGRKALIILSDGVDAGSKTTLVRSIESAQRADTTIYAIYFKGNESGGGNRGGGGLPGGIGFPGGQGGGGGRYPGGGYPSGGGGHGQGGGGRGPGGSGREHVDGKKILERMAQETGGRLFEVSKKQTVAQIYDQISEELRAQYRLGFTPNDETAADGYHEVTLETNHKDMRIQTRDGYYTGK